MTGKPIAVRWRVGCWAAIGLITLSCARSTPEEQSSDQALDRSARLSVSACGDGDPSEGNGIVLDAETVVTAAHVVAGGGSIVVRWGDQERPSQLVALNTKSDLAMITPINPLTDGPEKPQLASLEPGDPAVLIVNRGQPRRLETSVLQTVLLEADEVRGFTRSTRAGLIVAANTRPGDSGAGLYDTTGALAGLLFAVSTADPNRSWVTSAVELEALLAQPPTRYRCDPDRSKAAQTTGSFASPGPR